MSFLPYVTSDEILFTVLPFANDSIDKSFTITLSNVVGDATISRATGTVTIKGNKGLSVSNAGPVPYSLNSWPNPFTSVTEIHFAVPVTTGVSIELYDATGKKIRTLYEAIQETSEQTVSLTGDSLLPGIYYYSFILNGKSVAYKKLVLLR